MASGDLGGDLGISADDLDRASGDVGTSKEPEGFRANRSPGLSIEGLPRTDQGAGVEAVSAD